MKTIKVIADSENIFLEVPNDLGSATVEMSVSECNGLIESLKITRDSIYSPPDYLLSEAETDLGVLRSSYRHTITEEEYQSGCFRLPVSLLGVDKDKIHIFLDSRIYKDYKDNPKFKRYFSSGDFAVIGDIIVFKDYGISVLLHSGTDLMVGIEE